MIREMSNLQNDIQDRYSNNLIMNLERNHRENMMFREFPVPERNKQEIRRTFTTQKRLMKPSNYFSLESLILLVGLTASLLILPLVLPPLPPPPFMLLLIPIIIMVLLMVFALMPSSCSSNANDVTSKFM